MLVKVRQPGDRLDHVRLLVHHNQSGRPQAALRLHQPVKVHEDGAADVLREDRCTAAAGDHPEKVVPAADHPTTVALNQLLHRYGHLLLDGARVADVAADVEELRAGVPGAAKAGEPGAAAAADRRGDGHRLDVGHCGGAAKDANVGREGRLEARFAWRSERRKKK